MVKNLLDKAKKRFQSFRSSRKRASSNLGLAIKPNPRQSLKFLSGNSWFLKRVLVIGTSNLIIVILPLSKPAKFLLSLLNLIGFEFFFVIQENPQRLEKILTGVILVGYCIFPFVKLASITHNNSTFTHQERMIAAQVNPNKINLPQKEKYYKRAAIYTGKLTAASSLLGHSLFRLHSLNLEEASSINIFSIIGEFLISGYLFVSHLTGLNDEEIFKINNKVLIFLTASCIAPDFIGSGKSNIIKELNEKLFKPIVENKTLTKPTTDLDVPSHYSYPYNIEDLLYPINRLDIAKNNEKHKSWINQMIETAEIYQRAEAMNNLDSTTSTFQTYNGPSFQTYNGPREEMSQWIKRMSEENTKKKKDN